MSAKRATMPTMLGKKVLLALIGVLAVAIVVLFFVLRARAPKPTWYCGSGMSELCIAATSCPKEIEGYGCHQQERAFCVADADVRKMLFREESAPWPCFATAEACKEGAIQINAGRDQADELLARKQKRPPPETKNTPEKCSALGPSDAKP